MPKLQQPLKALRQRYSVQLNRGRELLSRQAARPQEFTRLVEDAESWDRESALLVQTTFVGEMPEYLVLPPPASTGLPEQQLPSLRAGVAGNLRRLEEVAAMLPATEVSLLDKALGLLRRS